MDSRRPSKKAGSVSSDPKGSTTPASDRPLLQDRTASAPTVARRRPSSSKAPETVKVTPIVDRSSKASIRDDPFYRPYQSPQSVRLADKSRASHGTHKSTKDTNEIIPQVNLVILGAAGVGKTTFVQKALDYREPPNSRSSAKKMSLDDVIYMVRLLEIPLENIAISESKRTTWPKTIAGNEMPPVDGVLMLFDVTNRESISEIPKALSAISKSTLPCVLVSCKCDNPPRARQVEPGVVEQVGTAIGGIDTFQTSANVPETQKRCISIILRSILARTSDFARYRSSTSPRRRAATSPTKERSRSGNRPHHRAKSDAPRSGSKGPNETLTVTRPDGTGEAREPSTRSDSSKPSLHVQTSRSSRSNSRSQPQTPSSGGRLIADGTNSPDMRRDRAPPSAPNAEHSARHERSLSLASGVYNSFLNMDDDHDEQDDTSRDVTEPSTPDVAKLKATDHDRPAEVGSSFNELVDRLLSLPMSKQEAKFSTIFLCLYRKFAAPAQLLTAMISRFDTVEVSKNAQLTKVADQLRHLNVMAQWVAEYPGDFAHPATRRDLTQFVKKLEKSRIFTFAAKQISSHLEVFVEDDDTGWALYDEDEPIAEDHETFLHSSLTNSPTSVAKSSVEDLKATDSKGRLGEVEDTSPRHSGAPSQASSTDRSGNTSGKSSTVLLTLEEAQREAQFLNPHGKVPLSKIQWHQFMEIPEDEFARELTRMDWIMYSSIRPRDLVRHVSLTTDQKSKTKSLENVDRMIDHFNHIAFFVSCMILLRDKPKHRAKALERFMHLAWKLRQQNNYNSLGAMIAGINGTAVNRLTQTHELLPHDVQKQFMRLSILMGTQKSHSAYRLAWENSFAERIPFLPLLRRDLVAAEHGNRTFVGENGDRINWRKFEVMGEVIVGIQRSQGTPYNLRGKNEEVQRLVLETKFVNEEESLDPYQELYDRSVHLEATGAGDTSRKKFWFR